MMLLFPGKSPKAPNKHFAWTERVMVPSLLHAVYPTRLIEHRLIKHTR